jgi:hypothetical protein
MLERMRPVSLGSSLERGNLVKNDLQPALSDMDSAFKLALLFFPFVSLLGPLLMHTL